MALNLDTLGLSATVTARGISAPDYQTILDTLTSYFRQIYGSDAYLEPDSKDGQMVALVALAVHDANNTAIGIYNSFSPTTAQAAALSSNVKINGIARKIATNSTADLLLTGTAGTTIMNGSARDKNGIIWNFPASVAIGVDGTVLVTATCANSGSVAALAIVGAPAETDAELRIRQGQSVALPSITPFESVDGAIANVAGVTRHKLYENDTGTTDSNGLPAHSISAIVDGGDITEIAQTIRGNKGQGTATYGKTSVTVPDTYGNPHVISFSRSTDVPILVAITLKVFTGYTSQIGEQIKQAVADYINGLTIGDDVLLSRIYSPANLRLGAGTPAIGIPFFCPSAAMPNTVMDEWSDMVFLKFNGATFSAETYPKLALVFPGLVLPESRGEFIRIWDDGRGVDSGRALLSAQAGSKIHEHVGQNGSMPNLDILSVADPDSLTWDSGWSVGSIPGFSHSSNGSNIQELRPRNIAFNFLVRAK